MKPIATGIFMWDREERVTGRYGVIYCGSSSYEGKAKVVPTLDEERLRDLSGKRVKAWCVVREARDSGHIGDLFLGITPSRPEVGECVDLGVAILTVARNLDRELAIKLHPGDGRESLWLDPRKLYRLHDQTVEIFIEETNEHHSPRPDIVVPAGKGMKSTGDGFQVSHMSDEEIRATSSPIPPVITPLGDGAFAVHSPGYPPIGTDLDIKKRR